MTAKSDSTSLTESWHGLPSVSHEEMFAKKRLDMELSYKYLKRNLFAPFELENGVLKVAIADPYDEPDLQAIRLKTGMEIQAYLSDEEAILRRIEMDFGLGGKGFSGFDGELEEDPLQNEDFSNLDELNSEAPAIRLFNYLLGRAASMGASDIHIEPQEHELRVRFRVDGVLQNQDPLNKAIQSALTSRVKIMAKLNIAERRRPQDGKISQKIGGKILDLRVSTLPTVHGESVVIRLLQRDTLGSGLSELGMSQELLNQLMEMISRPHGLILVTGPTGSGKTTTLYAALKQLISPDNKIITVEDPVEYRLSGVNQIQINPQVGLTFASGLRSIVRQDPDIILVGEIRDRETADIAIHAALTGHLVFATLHTNDAPSAITRLQDMGVDSYLISSALTMVMAQRLVRVLCSDCRKEAHYRGGHGINGAKEGAVIWRPEGCEVCQKYGYIGRTGIFEFMPIDDGLRDLVNKSRGADELRDLARLHGMRTLREDGWEKVVQGVTSLEEVLRVTAC